MFLHAIVDCYPVLKFSQLLSFNCTFNDQILPLCFVLHSQSLNFTYYFEKNNTTLTIKRQYYYINRTY
jgi:hypothetical protein